MTRLLPVGPVRRRRFRLPTPAVGPAIVVIALTVFVAFGYAESHLAPAAPATPIPVTTTR